MNVIRRFVEMKNTVELKIKINIDGDEDNLLGDSGKLDGDLDNFLFVKMEMNTVM